MPRLAAGALANLFLASIAAAATFVVRPGDSIQAAVDRAPAGSHILVRPGVYHDPNPSSKLLRSTTRHIVRRTHHPARPILG